MDYESNVLSRTFDVNSYKLPTIKEIKSESVLDQDDDYKISESFFKRTQLRWNYVKYCFPILTHEFILDTIKLFNDIKAKNVVDLCAGQGWMSFWLTKYGFPVLAIDDQSWKWDKEQFLSMVIKEDAVTYAKDHSEVDLFILSWPFMDNTAISIWKSMRKGQYLLYIGESEGGCTANDDFFHKTYDNEVTSPIENNFVAFFGIHDRPILFRK